MTKLSLKTTIWFVALVLILFWSLAPVYWVFNLSFLSAESIIEKTPFFPNSKFSSLNGYKGMFKQTKFGRWYLNSVILSFSASFLSLLATVPSSYAFSRMEFPGRDAFFYLIVLTMMFPGMMLTIPVFRIFSQLNLTNSYAGLIISMTLFSFSLSIWMLRGFFTAGIPANLEEAAQLEGCTKFGAFLRVILPISMPAIGAALMLSFLGVWNSFLWPMLMAENEDLYTATVSLYYLTGADIGRPPNMIMAATALVILPPLIFYGFLHRYLIEGLGALY